MKILFLSPLPPPNGGIAHWSKIVSDFGNKNGDCIKIIDTSPKIRAVDGRTKVQRAVKGIRSIFVIYRQLIKSIREDVPDAVHICTSGSLAFYRDHVILKCLKKKKIKTVYHLHFGRIPYLKAQKNREWELFLKNAKLADSVVAMNASTFYALSGIIDKEKLFNIPNPIVISDLPEPVSYDLHEKFILYLGWFQPNKGSEELLSAWQAIKNNIPDWQLKVVGPVKKEYISGLQSKGLCEDVEFCGEMKHVDAMNVMKKAGMFVLPSHSEGFPNVILEAMALKVPIVASRVGAIPEMLDDELVLSDVKDIVSLQRCILFMIENPDFRKAVIDKNYNKVIKEYDMHVVYQLYRKIWFGV